MPLKKLLDSQKRNGRAIATIPAKKVSKQVPVKEKIITVNTTDKTAKTLKRPRVRSASPVKQRKIVKKSHDVLGSPPTVKARTGVSKPLHIVPKTLHAREVLKDVPAKVNKATIPAKTVATKAVKKPRALAASPIKGRQTVKKSSRDVAEVPNAVQAPLAVEAQSNVAVPPDLPKILPSPVSSLICRICLEELEQLAQKSIHVTASSCGHIFCLTCLKKWTINKDTCPVCRRKFTFPVYQLKI